MEDIQALLQAAFADELAEHLAGMRAALAAQEAGEPVDLRAFFRRAHSLKGAARAVTQPETERLAHLLESELESAMAGGGTLDAAQVPTLRAQIDAIEDAAAGRTAPVEAVAATPVAESGDDLLRVSARAVERLTRSLHRLGSQAEEQAALGGELATLEAELNGLSALLERDGSGDARQRMARAMAALGRLRRGQTQARWGLDRAVAALEGDAERVLMVPAQMLFDGYERMVREVAESQNKQAVLRVTGGDVAADRRVLQALREPVLHMLRNAIGHGIEPPAVRAAAGKAEQGAIMVTVAARRGQLVLAVADDGKGLDDHAIAMRARAAGLIAPRAATPEPAALHALLFDQGFSTATAVDAISGRGIGLSVVAEAAQALHGMVDIAPRPGGGTVLTMTVPLSTSRQTVILFDVGGATYAVPAAAVARVTGLDPAALAQDVDGDVVLVDGVAVPLVSLAALLGVAETAATPGAMLMLHRGVALAVDALVAVRSLVVGDPGAIAADVPLVAGTLLLEDGVVALLLGIDAIVARARGARRMPVAATPAAVIRQKTILVVDDSITTRTLERGILESAGYVVRLSVDGLAGLEYLRGAADAIDLVVADVEMPRMDGFGLLAAIRNDPALRGIPVVMMTSRNSPDDIQRGLDLGADAYCTKQDFEQGSLLSVIGQLI